MTKTYLYTSALFHDVSFGRNQILTCFDAFRPDLVTSLYNLHEVCKDETLPYLCTQLADIRTTDYNALYERISNCIADYDLVLIQSFGAPQFTYGNADAITVASRCVNNIRNTEDEALHRQCIRALTIAYHILACLQQHKPFILYAFDPMIDAKFGINRYHGFAETDDMRLVSSMEAGCVIPEYEHYGDKYFSLCYAAKQYVFDFKADARLDFHKSILPALQRMHNSIYAICSETEWNRNCNTLPAKTEYTYFDILKHAKFTLCPPNYDGRCYSVKRAVDALRLGTIPIFVSDLEDKHFHKLDMSWQRILDFQKQHGITASTLDLLENIPDTARWQLLSQLRHEFKSIDIDAFKADYVTNWDKFIDEYVPFAKRYLSVD